MNEEFAKQLCLKVVYGGVLSEEEKPAWDSFIETEAGQQYLSQSSEMRLVLTGIAKVDLIPAVPQDLAKSFVATYRGKIETSQSAVCFMGMLSVVFLLLAVSEGLQEGFVHRVAMLLLAGAFIGIPALIANMHNSRVRRENDVIGFLKENHVKGKRIWNRIFSVIILLAPSLMIGGYWYWQEGLDRGLANFTWCLVFSLIVTGISLGVSRVLWRRENPKAFDWWHDELQQMDSV